MKEKLHVITFALFFLGLSLFAWLKPAENISDSELRRLAQKPTLSGKAILDGSFMKDFESYTLDQFPMREDFRKLKAITYLYGMRQLDNNGIYIEDGYAVKMEYPYNEQSVNYACDRFKNVYDKFIKESNANVYFTVVPDKNYYLADSHGALSMDYEQLFSDMKKGMSYAKYIDITGALNKSNYYTTDTHWNQVNIKEIADILAGAMGTSIDNHYDIKTAVLPFYGVYYGQAALPMKPDEMKYLTNSAIDDCKVFDWQNNKEMKVYDEAMLETRSPYDLFLGGSLSLITIENDKALTDKELVIFRDSFGSSISPLLISGYKKITMVDIRYLPGDRIGSFIEFNNQDVLFLYSTLVLNNSTPLK